MNFYTEKIRKVKPFEPFQVTVVFDSIEEVRDFLNDNKKLRFEKLKEVVLKEVETQGFSV